MLLVVYFIFFYIISVEIMIFDRMKDDYLICLNYYLFLRKLVIIILNNILILLL